MTTFCKLISKTYTQDALLNFVETEVEREVLCEEEDMGGAEWHKAKQNGLSPRFMLKTATINYQGETELEYNGKRFNIYRTYKDGDKIELYCEVAAGL